MSRAVVVRTGVANTASVGAALARCGLEPVLSDSPGEVEDARLLVLPGVGSFAAGMERLRERGLDTPIARRVRDARPTLAICLGLQLLARSSEESPGVEGLGVFDAPVTRFGDAARRPQFGWNRVTPGEGFDGCPAAHAYFANSYRLETAPPGWAAAWSDHAGPFVAALSRGPVLACQFHPELSGPWGLALLGSWIDRAKEAAPC